MESSPVTLHTCCSGKPPGLAFSNAKAFCEHMWVWFLDHAPFNISIPV